MSSGALELARKRWTGKNEFGASDECRAGYVGNCVSGHHRLYLAIVKYILIWMVKDQLQSECPSDMNKSKVFFGELIQQINKYDTCCAHS